MRQKHLQKAIIQVSFSPSQIHTLLSKKYHFFSKEERWSTNSSLFLKQELKYKAKTTKEFYKITSRIAAVGDRVDSQNGHQESVILSIFACGI